jgi:hypothetical protein
MRSFTPPAGTRFYAGVDLHVRALFLVILDRDGKIVFARNMPAAPEPFLRAVAPFRDRLLVACEGIDVYVGEFTDPAGIDVYQAKYFLKEGQVAEGSNPRRHTQV